VTRAHRHALHIKSRRFFVDDFRGHDLYQRFGGGPTTGYGDTPVAVHICEIG